MSETRKTIIGVLASHDDPKKNERLVDLLQKLQADLGRKPWWEDFAFAFTGGTYNRVILGEGEKEPIRPVNPSTSRWLHEKCGVLRLPEKTCGVTLLAYLVSNGFVHIVWPFLTPLTTHWLCSENLSLLRLCAFHNASTFMNPESVWEWAEKHASTGARRSVDWPLHAIALAGTDGEIRISTASAQCSDKSDVHYHSVEGPDPTWKPGPPIEEIEPVVIALIAHDHMKDKMAEFVYDFRHELRDSAHFSRILCTGTTGKVVLDASPSLEDKIYRYDSGPKGGDVEIATEILYGRCHVVVFFVDPMNPHPHTDDIRVVYAACMLQPNVRMFDNEQQARDWFETTYR